MSERYLVVGLGNPGKDYENTKHNVGFWTMDELARRHGYTFGSKAERKALTADGLIAGKRVLLAKPQTYMNLSGEAVRGLVDFYKIDLANILVVSDDLDLPLGTLRLRKEGSHGGQNGIRNIIQHLGTQNFARARIGIGRPPGKMPAAAYVLQGFKGDDEITIRQVVDRAASAVEIWLREGIDLAMTRANGSVLEPPA
ncbi:MAG TPA: aminoacyl-tRNA hydrolase [Phototrophicaceae bacterium]|jgi:PTH1 family peptidyl-tRNA hydrolase|nr:aminoacyl-tRNA hydrolase [Phototrophicaceae bacterium]